MSKTPVCILQELADKQNYTLRYELQPFQNKEDQRNTFQYKLTVGDLKVTGKGYSKQEAKQNAAMNALIKLPDVGEDTAMQFQPSTPEPIVLNVVGILNKFVQENDFPMPEFKFLSAIGASHTQQFTIECKVGTFSLQGTATTKRKAKYAAAKQMLELLTEMKPADTKELIRFRDLISCNPSPSKDEELVRDISVENGFMSKKKETSDSSLIAAHPECIKLIMKEKDLSYDELWSFYDPEDFDQLKKVLNKLDINISIKFMQGKNSKTLAFITLDTKPEFTLVHWAETKTEALDAAIKRTIDFMKTMTQ